MDRTSGIWTNHRWLHTVAHTQFQSRLQFQQLQKHFLTDLHEVHRGAVLPDGAATESPGNQTLVNVPFWVFLYTEVRANVPDSFYQGQCSPSS